MELIKKFSTFLLMLAICFNVMTMPVSAATVTQDGLEVTLTTDKEEYSEGEQVLLGITVKNTNQEEVTNVSLVDIVSDGYELDEEYVESMKQIGTLAAGEEVSFSVKAEAKEDSDVLTPNPDSNPNNPDSNQNTDQNNNNNQNNNQNSPQTGGSADNSVATVSSPNTGDSNNIAMWVIACIALCVGAGAITAVKNKKGKEFLSLLLCVAMVASTFVGASMPVSAAEDTTDEYTLMWEDNFEATELNRNYWNVETHEPGWVNQELQEYVDSTDNIYLEDGNLVIKAIKTGDNTYTSGRVNTQGKVDYTYGKFEARIKVPSGQGLWPAFWMMPTDESFYGQWPKCGEIDIMEILGHQTTTSYGTIHFGEPHRERQGTYNLASGDFSEEFHVFAVEWEPGEIRYYVDGQLFFTANDWYTKREGFDAVAYPAPFDQPFYMILNLAVGGSMPGNPDETTVFDENTKLVVDYVRVYQKDSYDENVTRPDASLKDPDTAGNFVVNSDFSVAEDLSAAEDWQFLLAEGGAGSASIVNITTPGQTTSEQKSIAVEKTIKYAGKDSTFKATFSYLHTEEIPGTSDAKMKIESTAAGTQNHSVQLVQANIPIEQGWKYEFSFDAYADANRTIIADISAPDEGWIRYFPDTTVNLTTTPQTFTYTFDMMNETDANGRVEFNLGNQGYTDTVYIDNVVVKKVSQIEVPEEEKSVLPDGNYVYNGAFDQGDNRLQYWEVVNNGGAEYSVTNVNNVREFKAVIPDTVTSAGDVVLKQSDLALVADKEYVLTFDAYADSNKTIQAQVAGQTFDAVLTSTKESYKYTFKTAADAGDFVLEFLLGTPGTIYIDNVRIQEDGMIVNGDFSNGLVGYEPFVDASANASFAVDELTYGGALVANIKDTGDQDWKIQLKQIVTLEKDKTYKISFDAKSTLDRVIMYAIQRDGAIHKNADGSENWTPYSDTKVINLTNEYQNFSQTFTMTADTDENAILSISMGAVSGTQITTAHDVIIDNIVLEEVEAPAQEEDSVEGNMISESGWDIGAISSPGVATSSAENGEITYNITNVGTEDNHVQLKSNNFTMEQGASYTLKFNITSTVDRQVLWNIMDPADNKYTWYGGETLTLGAGTQQQVNYEFTVGNDGAGNPLPTTDTTKFFVSMGCVNGASDIDGHTITITDVSLVKTADAPSDGEDDTETDVDDGYTSDSVEGNMVTNGDFGDESYWYTGGTSDVNTFAITNGKGVFNIGNVGSNNWDVQLNYPGLTLEQGATYAVKFQIKSTAARKIRVMFSDSANNYAGCCNDEYYIDVPVDDYLTFERDIIMTSGADGTAIFQLCMGNMGDNTPASTITVDNLSIVKKTGATGDSSGGEDTSATNASILTNGDFTNGTSGWQTNIHTNQQDGPVGTISVSGNDAAVVYELTEVGTANWHVQLKQTGLTIENGATYLVKFDIASTVARTVEIGFYDSADESKYLGNALIPLEANVTKNVNQTITVQNAGDNFTISMGKIFDYSSGAPVEVPTPASTITIDNISIVKQ